MNYPTPARDSGLGVHLGTNAWFPLGENEANWPAICDDLVAMGISWVKIITTANDLLSAIRVFEYQGNRNLFAEHGLMPIVRFLWDKTYPVRVTSELLENIQSATRRFREKGVWYFECDNEPNLLDEWVSEDEWHKYDAPDARPNHAADVWLAKAAVIAGEGGIPLLTALAPGGHHDDEDFYPRMIRRLKMHPREGLLRQSAIAVHNYWLNHPIDFPYDAINQAEHGAVTIHSGRGMSNAFLKHQYVHDVFEQIMGFGIPVLTTEGGPRLTDHQDGRYPQVTLDVHRAYVLQQAEYMATKAPSWYFCTNDWVLASKEFGGSLMWESAAWVSPVRNPTHAPIIDALKQRGFVKRNMAPDPVSPPVDTLPDFIKDVVLTLPRHPTNRYATRLLSKVKRIVIHHTASWRDTTTPEAIASYHVNHHGWPGSAYHVVIDGAGQAYLVNRLETDAAGATGFNTDSVHVTLTGFFTDFGKERPSDAQLATARKVLAWLYRRLNLGPENVTGHKNLPGHSTECPGSGAMQDWWRALVVTQEIPIAEVVFHCEQAARDARDGKGQQAHDRLIALVLPYLIKQRDGV